MEGTLRIRVVKIGNSRGLRLPKLLIEQLGIKDEVEVMAEGGALIVRPVRSAREGWDEAARRMAACGDDRLPDPEYLPTTFDEQEWEW